jgi:nitroimidazol reductase NimA-like FMN-containing flavoprotein (pyridoxamine 5'-phosphate oxidase superfamily)
VAGGPGDPTRLSDLYVSDREALDSLLDDEVLAQVALVVDGRAVVIPTAMARHEDRLLIHGSTGSPWMRSLAAGAEACVSVTATDGIIVARSTFESSFAYRSAVLFGRFSGLEGQDKLDGLDLLSERFVPGRTAEVRRPTARELAATLVLAMPIGTWTLKVSDGWPEDPADDVAGPAWAGVVRFEARRAGRALAAPDLRAGITEPASIRALTSESADRGGRRGH